MKKPSATTKKPSATMMLANLEKRVTWQRLALDQALGDLAAAKQRAGLLPKGPPWNEDTAYGIVLLEAMLNDPRMTDDDLRTQVKLVVGTYATPISEGRQYAIRMWLDAIYASRPRCGRWKAMTALGLSVVDADAVERTTEQVSIELTQQGALESV
jgi:hypothetical protein